MHRIYICWRRYAGSGTTSEHHATRCQKKLLHRALLTGPILPGCCGEVTTAKRILRSYDLVARIGGEKFCALLPETDIRQAAQIADRLRPAIAALKIDELQGRQVTASTGIHEAKLLKESFGDMLRLADDQLYEAKAGAAIGAPWRQRQQACSRARSV
ncbi:MAG TPA: GGDEF domain-containing protein [Bosea sp. (in: a-proteobacteria)]|nr:GGDEF domain-containing protein [Bosea sp. (in: a-proteobacteria)]